MHIDTDVENDTHFDTNKNYVIACIFFVERHQRQQRHEGDKIDKSPSNHRKDDKRIKEMI